MTFSLDHVKVLLETEFAIKLKNIQSMIVDKFKRAYLAFSRGILQTLSHYKQLRDKL